MLKYTTLTKLMNITWVILCRLNLLHLVKINIVTSLKHVQQDKWLFSIQFSFTLAFTHRLLHVECNEILSVGVRHALLESYKVFSLPVILGVPSVVTHCFCKVDLYINFIYNSHSCICPCGSSRSIYQINSLNFFVYFINNRISSNN